MEHNFENCEEIEQIPQENKKRKLEILPREEENLFSWMSEKTNPRKMKKVTSEKSEFAEWKIPKAAGVININRKKNIQTIKNIG